MFGRLKNNQINPLNNKGRLRTFESRSIMPPKPKLQPKNKPKAKAPSEANRLAFLKNNSFAIGLFLITFVVFFNGIGNNYALDDEFYTNGGNKLTQKGVHGIKEIFRSHTFFNNDGTGYSYRPVTVVSFALENQFFGENPHVSHFFNVLLYALTIVLIFTILRKWFVTQGNWFSFFICLIFIVHPLHTEVVDNIKCRDELLAMLFVLLSMWAVWKHVETKKWFFLLLYPVFFWAAMLSKHTAVPFYFLIPISLWFFSDTKLWKIAAYVAPLFITSFITFLLLRHGLADESRAYLLFENPLASHPGFAVRTATSFYVIGRYLFLLFIPHPLVYYYGSFYVPDITWGNPIAILSLLVYAAIGIWTLMEVRKKSILGFGLLFYLINIAAYSNLLQCAPGIMAERYTYAASLGFCIVIMVMLFRFTKIDPAHFKWKLPEFSKVRFIILGITLIFSARTFLRTSDWKDKETLYGHDMEYLHESVKANMLYASLISSYALRASMESRVSDGKGGVQINPKKQQEAIQRFGESRECFKHATELAPYYFTAWSNLGTTYFFTGETKSALPYFLKSVKIKSDYAEGWYNVGMAYDKLERSDSAIYAFSQSIKSDSSYVDSYSQLSRLLNLKENNPREAVRILQLAAIHKPDSEYPWTNLAGIYLQQKDSANYEVAMKKAVQINPENLRSVGNLAQYYKLKKDFDKFNQYDLMARALEEKQQELQRKKRKDKEEK